MFPFEKWNFGYAESCYRFAFLTNDSYICYPFRSFEIIRNRQSKQNTNMFRSAASPHRKKPVFRSDGFTCFQKEKTEDVSHDFLIFIKGRESRTNVLNRRHPFLRSFEIRFCAERIFSPNRLDFFHSGKTKAHLHMRTELQNIASKELFRGREKLVHCRLRFS